MKVLPAPRWSIIVMILLGIVALACIIALSVVCSTSVMPCKDLQLSIPCIYGNNPITVVTAYYDIPSKAPKTTYMERMELFFANVPCHLIVFTAPELLKELWALREKHDSKTRMYFIPFQDLENAKDMDFWKLQLERDLKEQHQHTPELYAIWAEKTAFLELAAKANPFKSDAFIWLDAGYFRDKNSIHQLASFPSVTKLKRFNPTMAYFLEVGPFTKKDRAHPNTAIHDDHLGGGAIIVHRSNVTKLKQMYIATRKALVAKGILVAKDESVYNAMYLEHPEFIGTLPQTPWKGNHWFYFTWYLCDAFCLNDV